MTIKYTTTPILCFHCGNETIFEIATKFEDSQQEFMYDEHYREDVPIGVFFSEYTLYKCPVCSNVTLKNVESNTFEIDHTGRPIEYDNILYPISTGDLSGLPDVIKKAYESAIKTKNVDKVMCAIGLRRTLEMLCNDQGAEGRSLYNKLQDLSNKAIIPRVLDKASHIIRNLGNAAAHAEEVELDKQTINDLIRFTKIILEYVYVIPDELSRIQEKFEIDKVKG